MLWEVRYYVESRGGEFAGDGWELIRARGHVSGGGGITMGVAVPAMSDRLWKTYKLRA